MSLQKEIKRSCKDISKQKIRQFEIFNNPIELYKKYGNRTAYNIFKGNILEIFLEELFIGNGYIVNRIGERGKDGRCDLMVKYPNDNSVRFIVQAKNWNIAINKYDIIKEFSKFQDNYKKRYNLNNNHFCFIAWKYVKEIKQILSSKLNIRVWDESDIINKLFLNYNPKKTKKPQIFLESYQKSAFNKIIHYWNKNQKCYVEFATGTGKTYIIAKLVEKLIDEKNNKILILSPSKYINDRIKELLVTFLSSSNIGRRFNPTKIVNLLTYQYIYHNSHKIRKGCFSHIIMDEAHRAGAIQWFNKGLKKIVGEKTKIVGFSATIERYSAGINITEFLDNNCAGKLTLFQAMAREIIPTGKYVLSTRDVKEKIKDIKFEVRRKYRNVPTWKNKIVSKFDVKKIKDYSIKKILLKYFGAFKYQKIIVFCEGMKHSIDTLALLEKTFYKLGNIIIEKITSYNPKKENKKILDKFSNTKPNKNQLFIIVAIDMLNEGIDVSGIDSVILFRKTESPRIYFQQIGRALRSGSNKEPLIFDCVLNYQNLNIKFFNELDIEFKKYRNSLDEFGFSDIEIPKSLSITDELRDIAEIINDVERQLNFYPTYEKAKKAVQKLEIKSETEYKNRYYEDPRLPSKPKRIYLNRGWIDDYDFFGTKRPNFYSIYKEAKKSTQKLKITSLIEYKKRYKEDPLLPSQPDRTYSNEWEDWPEYFGISNLKNYPSYIEARNAVRILNIKSPSEYRKRYREDLRLPCHPNHTYKKDWKGFNDFLGVETIMLYPTLGEAKKAVKRLNIKSEREYRQKRHKDPRLPATPSRYYNKEWSGYPDFFDKPFIVKYPKYNDAKKAVEKLNIKSSREYSRRYKKDPRLPSRPENYYSGIGWIDYDHFLGFERHNFYQTYIEAKEVVKKIGIKSRKEYIEDKRYKEDTHLPSQPNVYYKNKGWSKWNDFIPIYYPAIAEAKNSVRNLGIKRRVDYVKYKRYKEDVMLPSNPEKIYVNKGWSTWPDFLGSRMQKKYRTFNEAKMAVRKLKIKSMKEYKIRRHEDPKLPSNPSECYRNKGWKSPEYFLGIAKKEFYNSYREAKKVVNRLGIKKRSHYIDMRKYKEDPKLPSNPETVYNNKGWEDWYSFLGTERKEIYATYKEAKKALIRLGIKNREEYRKTKAYKKNPRLPSSPDKKYKGKGWISWKHFFK